MTYQQKLIEAYEKYVTLLSNELDRMFGIAYVHGYKSPDNDVKAGQELREEISLLKLSLSTHPSPDRNRIVVPSEEDIIKSCPDFNIITKGDFDPICIAMMEEAFISGSKHIKSEIKRLNSIE